MDTDLEVVAEVEGAFRGLCAVITAGQWTLSTPCDDWNLAQLVDHVTGGNLYTVRILDGASSDDALAATLDSFGGGHATAAEAISAMEEMTAALAVSGVMDRSYHHIAGDLAGRQVLRLRMQDLIVHTWDIGQTIDPPASLSPALVEWGLAELDRTDSLTRQHFAPEAPDRTPRPEVDLARYLAVFGR